MASRSRSLFRARRKPLVVVIALALAATATMATAATAITSAATTNAESSYSLSDLDLPDLGAADAAAAGGSQNLYLDVYFGARPSGQLAEVQWHDGRLFCTPDQLRALGVLVPEALPTDEHGLLALDALPGLVYHYDVAAQRLVLDVPPTLRPRQRLGYRVPEPVQVTRSAGLLFNYDAYARSLDGQRNLSAATLMRWFGRAGALETSGVSRLGDGADGYRRLDTRWSYSDPVSMSTWTVGDLISGGLAWTRPVRLGGVQWRRNFGVRPDLVTFPMPRFAGQATVPSAVELLVNNVQQFGADIDDGPFVLDAFPRITGAGEATLLVRDALGRTTQTSVPIYVDAQRLAPGLSDFSLEAGNLRRGYATDDDRYDGSIVASGSYRRGMTDDLTLEAHAEYAQDLRLGGLGAVWAPGGHWGLATAALARSDSGGSQGSQRTYGYQWMNPRLGLDLQTQRRSRGFRDIGDLADQALTPTAPRQQDRASFWVTLPHSGSLTASWLRWRDGAGNDDRINTFGWSQLLGPRLYANLSVFDSARSGRGVGLSFILPLGDQRDATLSLNHGGGRTDVVGGLRQTAAYDGGLGWDLQAGDRDGGYALASATVRGRYGEATVGADRVAGSTGYFAQGDGSLVWMGGGAFASRRVSDSFAVVSSNGVSGLPVLYENRRFGVTDDRGLLLLPDLRGWQRNRIAVDPDALGVGYRVPLLEQFATPADSGGVVMRFDIAKVHPALVTLLDRDGAPVAAGSEGRIGDSSVLVGLDGQAYVDDLKSGGVLELDLPGRPCRYLVPDAPDGGDDIAHIGPLRCEGTP